MKLSTTTLRASALLALALSASSQDHERKPIPPPVWKATAAEAPGAASVPLPGSVGGGGERQPALASLALCSHPLQEGVVYGLDSSQSLWAASRSWKARFDPDGATFVPFLGSRQPRNQPLRLRLESLTAGGVELASAAGEPWREGDRVRIARGAVEEAWQLSEEGAEQLFVLRERPAPGEIVVRVGFEGEYSAELDEQGVLFTGELGAVRYGLAFAFDAAGRRTSVAQELEGDSILLRVPASFVAAARFPLTIDPIVSSFALETVTLDTIQPDVAFESATGRYLFVYELAFSQTDHDIYSVLADDAGVLQGTTRAVDASSTHWTRPRVASNRSVFNFLVVAEVGSLGTRQVRGRLVDALSGNSGPELQLTSGISGEHIRPDVGGNPNNDPTARYCLVFERIASAEDRDILARMVNPLNGTTSSLLWVENSSGTYDEKPAIASSCGFATGGTPYWTIVWQRRYAPSDRDVYGARISAAGTIVGPTFAIDTSAYDDIDPCVSPIVDGAGALRLSAVAFSRASTAWNRDILVASMLGSQVQQTVNLSLGQNHSSLDDLQPSIDTDGHLFAVAYTKDTPLGNTDVWLNWVYAAGSTLERLGGHELIAGTTQDESRPAIVARRALGSSWHDFALAFQVSGAPVDVRAVIARSPEGVPVESVCKASVLCPCGPSSGSGGCANSSKPSGAKLGHAGMRYVSADTLVLAASDMPGNVPCLFLQGMNALNQGNGVVFGDGLRCVGGGIVRLATKFAQGGAASYPGPGDLPVAERGQVPELGGTRYYQVWYRDPTSFCTVDKFNFTNGLKVIWLP